MSDGIISIPNLADIDSDAPVLPGGQYEFEVVDASLSEPREDSKYAGTPMLKLQLRPVDGPDEFTGNVFDNILLTNDLPMAIRKYKQLVLAAGVSFDEAGNVDVSEFIGKHVGGVVSVKDDERYGKRNNVRKYIELI